MGAFSERFSLRFKDPSTGRLRTEQYPQSRTGQTGKTVKGADPSAVDTLRGKPGTSAIKLTAKGAKALAATLTDGGRITAYEKPVYNAVIRAAKGELVQITDATGHWRDLDVGKQAAKAFELSVKGTHFA